MRRPETVSDDGAAFATVAFVPQEQRTTAKEQRETWLFFRSPNGRRPGISAENEMPLADNLPQKQQKQRERHAPHDVDRCLCASYEYV